MRNISKLLIVSLILALIIGTVALQAKPRKLPVGTYIKSAKIEILSGELDRLQNAIYMLDSLFYWYGPHAEGLYWMHQIQVDILEQTPNLIDKQEPITKMVAYRDSLHLCCENEEIKDKYRNDCDEYVAEVDSTAVLYWRTFYNAAVAQISEVGELTTAIDNEPDSIARQYYVERRAALLDSTKDNMLLSIMIDSTDPRSYIGLASAYKESKEYDTAMVWLNMALERASEDSKPTIWIEAAYNRIQSNKYCEAIPYFNEYCNASLADSAVMADPQNVANLMNTLTNLGICLNNCRQYDSAYAINSRILEYQPENIEVLQNCGRYHSQMARVANDSASYYRDLDDSAGVELWQNKRMGRFDSAKVYLRRVFELSPGQLAPAEELGVICSVTEDWDCAIEAFSTATEADPTMYDNWVSLGDAYLRTQQWTESAAAYEKAVELKPDKIDIWRSLEALYKELKDTAKQKAAAAKVAELKG